MATLAPPDGAADDKVIVHKDWVFEGDVGVHENPARVADAGGANIKANV